MRPPLVVIRGAGELGTGVAHALVQAGARVLLLDRPLPRALRLTVAFAYAAVQERTTVEGVEAVHCRSEQEVVAAWAAGSVPLWTRAERELALAPEVLVDARMRQVTEPLPLRGAATLTVGIGPGFVAGEDVDFVIESNRGPALGRLLARGSAEAYTGLPGLVAGFREERILRSPCAGPFERRRELGDLVAVGELVGEVQGEPVRARLAGMIRGLKLSGVLVGASHKVGDVDPRNDRTLLTTMSDKARAVGAGVVSALVRAGLLGAELPVGVELH